MATSTQNSTTVSSVTVPGSNSIASLLYGSKWGSGTAGTGVELTYSFPTSSSSYSYRYEWSGGSALSSAEQQAVRDALETWSNVADITFVEVPDNSTVVGELRFAESTKVSSDGSSAWSYLPDNGTWAGDTWLSPTLFSSSADNSAGSWNFMTIVHEIGHALGLKHPFETSTASSQTLSTEEDSYFFTVMSYSALAGNSSAAASIYPTTPMLYDIAAIQYLYGANYDYNSGDTVYTYSGTGSYWETIWDGGGTDTIVYDSSTGGTISLGAGTFSSLGQEISYGRLGSSPYTVAVAYDVTIENAIGGSGGDIVIGNAATNAVWGQGGGDLIYGNAGGDWLYGNDGGDTVFGGQGGDIVYGGGDNDVMSGDRDDDHMLGDAGNDILYGNAGGDYLYGADGDDTIYGGQGNDYITGDGGNDWLSGDLGADYLLGGSGSDRFVIGSSAAGGDVIGDFSLAEDLLVLIGSSFGLTAGVLDSGHLVHGAAVDGDDYFLFDAASGTLWYDADGSGAGGASVLVALAGVSALTSASIVIV